MAEAIGANNQTETPASNLDGAIDATQWPGSLGNKHSHHDSLILDEMTTSGLPPKVFIPHSDDSRDSSPSNYIGQVYSEKIAERSPPRRIHYRQSSLDNQEKTVWSRGSDGAPTPLRNGIYRESMADDLLKPSTPTRRKKGGLRTAIRRLFGKRSVKNRISLPNPAGVDHDGSGTVKASAEKNQMQRSASAPTQDLLHSSALGSHSPFPLQVPPYVSNTVQETPPRPERAPPEPPTRPRRASLPSVILTSQEAEAVNAALTGLGLQDAQDHAVEGANIGFAVTSGSNPRRRSRSAGALRDTAKEHRMSPIQWRRWRRRSDEIRYWRESRDESSTGMLSTGFGGTEPSDSTPEPVKSLGEGFVKPEPDIGEEDEPKVQDEGRAFNFALPAGDILSQEHIGLEERMITLEIKLMDFEYTISKLQAGIPSPVDRSSRHFTPINLAEQVNAQPTSENSPASYSNYPINHPANDYSPTTVYGPSLDTTPVPQQHPFPAATETIPSQFQPGPRPTSVATTLKPSPVGQRSSIPTGLTFDHYATLISLIRHEQSARLRLEDQVSTLSHQLQLLQKQQASSPKLRALAVIDNNSSRPSSSAESDDRRRRRHTYRQERGRSSVYSEDQETTDTDDDNFHDVYVTPVERGEYERRQLKIAEGVAF